MKQFLRFQISGITFVLWLMLYFIPYISFTELSKINANDFIASIISLIAFGLPLGCIIHQISVTLFSPFRKHRLFFFKRTVLKRMDDICKVKNIENSDIKNESILTIQKSIKISWTDKNELKKELDIEYIRTQIENRYSYYYVRIDNGIIAPLTAFLLFLVLKECLYHYNISLILLKPIISWWVIPSISLIIGIILLVYIPVLLKEIDDIEIYILKFEDIILSEKRDSDVNRLLLQNLELNKDNPKLHNNLHF